MTRSYGLLAIGTAVLALALVLAIRAPRAGRRPDRPLPGQRPAATVSLEVVAGSMRPSRSAAAKGTDLTVRLVNRDRVPRTVALLGYEDLVPAESVAPGDTVRLRFVSARPGEDFAWLVDGRPAGSFAVLGSHLVEGHR